MPGIHGGLVADADGVGRVAECLEDLGIGGPSEKNGNSDLNHSTLIDLNPAHLFQSYLLTKSLGLPKPSSVEIVPSISVLRLPSSFIMPSALSVHSMEASLTTHSFYVGRSSKFRFSLVSLNMKCYFPCFWIKLNASQSPLPRIQLT